jgi:hypothetical protein
VEGVDAKGFVVDFVETLLVFFIAGWDTSSGLAGDGVDPKGAGGLGTGKVGDFPSSVDVFFFFGVEGVLVFDGTLVLGMGLVSCVGSVFLVAGFGVIVGRVSTRDECPFGTRLLVAVDFSLRGSWLGDIVG